MLRKLLTAVGVCFGCLYAEHDLEFEVINNSGHVVIATSNNEAYSYLADFYGTDEIESGASFHHGVDIFQENYRTRADYDRIALRMVGDSGSEFAVWWDNSIVQMSCPKGYRIKQNRDKNKFTFVLLPD